MHHRWQYGCGIGGSGMLGTLLRILVAVMIVAAAGPGFAQQPDRLAGFLAKVSPGEIFPGADAVGPVSGTPPAAPAYAGGRLVGHVFLNSDATDAGGYSGKPIHVVAAVDLAGTIVGIRLLEHSEPIVMIGVSEADMRQYIQGHVGLNVLGAAPPPDVDIVSGATVSALIINDTVVRAAARVLQSRQASAPAERRIDMTQDAVASWPDLIDAGAVAGLQLSVGEVNDAFAKRHPAAAANAAPGRADATYVKLYTALPTAPAIGRSLLGDRGYLDLRQRLGDRSAIMIMGHGPYSWRGGQDRVVLVQRERIIHFKPEDATRVADLEAAEAPYLSTMAVLAVSDPAFDPTAPWRLRLRIERQAGDGIAAITYDLPYQLPETYLVRTAAPPAATVAAPESERPPLWMRIWLDRAWQIAVVGAALVLLTLLFFFQDWLVKRPRLHFYVRTAFLAWTLLWLGWYALAQLSVVNVLTLTTSLVGDFSWDTFLIEPLVFVLWSAVAASLLFWGRGAFCGWLCPFGALQEFANRLGRRLRIPQMTVPWSLHERLWPFKYMVFLGLFGVALSSLALAERLAEIEPFKTAIVLHFLRAWPFVLYAVMLLVVGLFIERVFCRYVCPLGAAIAIPARLRMFEWLKRHRECGNPCQRCAQECPVASIHPDGRINPNECIYCMHCQLLYWDDYKCPAMIQRRLRRERAEALSSR